MDVDPFAKLPRNCFIHLLLFTAPTPRDLCRLAVVSKSFQSAAESDSAWEKFLPPDYVDILSQAVQPVEFSSKKELYFLLCQPIILGDQTSLQLEKATGKKIYMISARKLDIEWVNDPRYWSWKPLADSRFGEAVMLEMVSWLSIVGSINSQRLSRKTVYQVYIVFKLEPRAHHLNVPTQVGSINFGTYVSEKRITLILEGESSDVPREREDGWLEISLGEFYYDEGDEGDVGMSLQELHDQFWKYGLILLGFEVRPKETCLVISIDGVN